MKRTADEGRRLVRAEEILAKIERGEDVVVKDKIIKGDLDLDKIDLPTRKVTRNLLEAKAWDLEDDVKLVKSKIKIINSHFFGAVVMANAVFVKSVDFEGTTFDKGVDFRGDKFNGYAHFMDTQFGNSRGQDPIQEFHFEATEFLKDTYFIGAYFFGEPNFERAEFQNEIDLNFAEFHEIARFVNVKFDGEARFDNARFYGDANFALSNFQKYAYFSARFSKNLDLCYVKFHDVANFGAARFNENSKIKLNQAEFAKLYVNWSHFKDRLIYDLEGGESVYLALIENFRDLGWFEDADDCYYEYRKAKMMEKGGSNWSKFYDYVALLSCGYGVRPGYTLACIIISMYIFWIIFLGCSRSIIESIYFSVASLIGSTPESLPAGTWKYAVVAEGLFGYLFLALFIVVLARKFIR